MTFLDTGILVGSVLRAHPEHAACLSAIEDFEKPFTNAHALAETFATLSGFYKVPTGVATELTLSLRGIRLRCTRWISQIMKRLFVKLEAAG
jgi:predicted nucleic acid-binding protein